MPEFSADCRVRTTRIKRPAARAGAAPIPRRMHRQNFRRPFRHLLSCSRKWLPFDAAPIDRLGGATAKLDIQLPRSNSIRGRSPLVPHEEPPRLRRSSFAPLRPRQRMAPWSAERFGTKWNINRLGFFEARLRKSGVGPGGGGAESVLRVSLKGCFQRRRPADGSALNDHPKPQCACPGGQRTLPVRRARCLRRSTQLAKLHYSIFKEQRQHQATIGSSPFDESQNRGPPPASSPRNPNIYLTHFQFAMEFLPES